MYEYKSSNMSYAFDIENFISEIRCRPAIWDVNCEDFKYKIKKQNAWEEVARVFIKDIDDLTVEEKWDVYKKLQGKWRNLRDAFVRNLKKKKDGKNNYTYARNLAFLSNVYEGGDKYSAEIEEWQEEVKGKKKKRETFFKWEPDPDTSSYESKKMRTDEVPIHTEFVDTPLLNDPTSSYPVEDEDRSFFESLLPAVRNFDLDQKIEFRCEVLKLIKNFRQKNSKKSAVDCDGDDD